jgi:hypothetical protein
MDTYTTCIYFFAIIVNLKLDGEQIEGRIRALRAMLF